MRDYLPTDTYRKTFGTVDTARAPANVTGGQVHVYVNDSLTESSTGVGFTSGYDGRVGVNRVTISIATAGIAPGSYVALVLTGTIDGVAIAMPIDEFTVLAQGAEIAARGTISAVANNGGTLSSVGTAKAGDLVRMVNGTSKGYKVIDALNTGTGAFTFRAGSVWTTNPANGDAYEIISMPQVEPAAAQDFADGFITSAKLADNAITAPKIATDAISGAKVAADAVTKIQANLATAAGQTTITTAISTTDGKVVNIQGRLPAALVGGKMDSAGSVALGAPELDAIRAAIFGHLVEAGLTFDNAMKIMTAIHMGKVTGLTSATPSYSSADVAGGAVVGTRPRISATRESDGDRLTVTLDFTPT